MSREQRRFAVASRARNAETSFEKVDTR
jgi:hypothetical protein